MAKKKQKTKPQWVEHAISVRQPWAHLIIRGDKDVENRSQRTHHRGPVAIHASSTVRKYEIREHGFDPEKLVTGAVIGVVDFVDCVQDSRSKWAQQGKWHWILKNPRPLMTQIPLNGQLGIFRLEKKIRLPK